MVTSVADVKLLDKLKLPPIREGVTPILPGECTIRDFDPGAPQIHRYNIILPPGKRGSVSTYLSDFKVVDFKIFHNDVPVPTFDREGRPRPPVAYGKFFNTGNGGEFLLEVFPHKGKAGPNEKYGWMSIGAFPEKATVGLAEVLSMTRQPSRTVPSELPSDGDGAMRPRPKAGVGGWRVALGIWRNRRCPVDKAAVDNSLPSRH